MTMLEGHIAAEERQKAEDRPGRRAGRRGRDRYEYHVTLSGLLFTVALTLIGLAAMNTRQALLFAIFGMMLGATVLSALLGWRMLAGVAVTRDLPARAFAHQVVHLGYRLRRLRRHWGAVGLEVAELDPPAPLQTVGAYCLYLPPGGRFRSGSRLVFRRRGSYRLGGLRLTTRFPFALIRSSRDIAGGATLIVWPALGTLRADILVRGASEISDAAPSQFRSGSDEFFGLREYRQGDSPRWIHWKRTASTGVPVVREMSKPRPDVLYIVLDTQLDAASEAGGVVAPSATTSSSDRTWLQTAQPRHHELRERLIRFAATLAEHAFHRQYRVGLALGCADRVIALAAGAERGRRTDVLDALAEVDDNRQTTLQQVLGQLPRRHLRDAQVVVVTPEAGRAEKLSGLRGVCREVTVVAPERLDELFEDDPNAGKGD